MEKITITLPESGTAEEQVVEVYFTKDGFVGLADFINEGIDFLNIADLKAILAAMEVQLDTAI